MLVGGSMFARRRTTFLLVIVALFLLPVAVWYSLALLGVVDAPSSTSLVGFGCGLVAGAIVLFEMGLWVRKKMRGYRRVLFIPLGSAKRWMFLHIWLGLLALPLALIHSGFQFGGPLSAWVLALFIVVSASGIWGLALQQSLPERLLSDIPQESVASQIDVVMRSHLLDAEQLILALTDTHPVGEDEFLNPALRGNRPQTLAPSSAATVLRDFFTGEIVPYLLFGQASHSALRSADQTRHLFARLYEQLPAHAREHVQKLEQKCDLRRELDTQRSLNYWLHGWLYFHFPFSVALMVLMIWHAVVALKFW